MKLPRGVLLRRAVTAAPRASAAGSLLLLVSSALQVAGAYAFASAIGGVSTEGLTQRSLAWLLTGAGALVGVALCSAVFRPIWGGIAMTMTQSSVEQALMAAAQRETVGDAGGAAHYIDAAAELGSMRHRETLFALPEYLTARVRGLSGAAVLAFVSPWAALVLAAVTVLYGRFFTAMLADVLASLGHKNDDSARARATRAMVFNRSLWGEFRVFGAHRWLIEHAAQHSARARAASQGSRSRHTRAVVATGVALMVLYFAAFWWLTTAAFNGDITVAALMLAFQAGLMLLDLGPIGDIAVMYGEAEQTEARYRINASTPAEPPRADDSRRVAPSDAEGAQAVISLRDVRFAYPGAEHPTVCIDALTIARGERVGIVGRNGAGKSTLLGFIAGYISGHTGSIEIAPASELAVALQAPARYPATLRDNVELGRETADLDHAVRVLGSESRWDRLCAEDELGSRSFDGKDLSGGQWQRVGLARAVAREGGVLLLDEPSASLDPKAEAAFFRSVMAEDTWDAVVVTTHYLPNVRFVDRIIVLDEGRVVQSGTHTELMAAGGLYAELFTTQANLYGVDTDA